MLVVGLTGGIGSGKTKVSDIFAQHGVPIIDTDVVARELVAPGQPALQEIVQQFGPACLKADGALDRAYLRETVFNDSTLRKRLEAILHPRIRHAVHERLEIIEAPYCLVVIPLLIETGMTDLIDRILVVDVAPEVQISRVAARDSIDENQAKHILAAQANRAERLAVADDIIDNSGTLTKLENRISVLHQQYLELAAK